MHVTPVRSAFPWTLRTGVAAVAAACAVQPGHGLAQQVVVDGRTATTLTVSGTVTDVTTQTVIGPNAFNAFHRFDVFAGNTVNLHVPTAASNLVNLVTGPLGSRIDGTLNAVAGGTIGGNVFFLNPHGVVVGQQGVINVGALTLITPTQAFTDSFFDTSGAPNAAAVAALLAGDVPISDSGLISVQGRINARGDVKLAAANIVIPGAVLSGAVFQQARVDFGDVVNVAGLTNADAIRVDNGTIEIVATQDVALSGTVASEGANGLDGGAVRVRAGRDLTLADSARVSVRGSGDASSGGTANLIADGVARLANGARVDASAGRSGDGGTVAFSGHGSVHVDGGNGLRASAGSVSGRAGSIAIDPAEIVWTGSGQDVFTDGATLLLWAEQRIVLDNVTLSTRRVGGGTDRATHLSGASTGDSGHLYLWARDAITLQNGSRVLAHATGTFAAGDVRIGALVELPADLSELPGRISAIAGGDLPDVLPPGITPTMLLGVNPIVSAPMLAGSATTDVTLNASTIRGGNLRIGAGDAIDIGSGSVLATRRVAAGADLATGASSAASGRVDLLARTVSIDAASVLAGGTGAVAGGAVAIAATEIDEISFLKDAQASVTLRGATVTGS
nr:leukotoxin LktA family filamentous adhesin [Burkholderiales bacterium]